MKRSRPHKFHDDAGHRHQHGAIDPKITSTKRGKWAVKWTFALLMATALLQVIVVAFSGSVALLADTLHNFGDAFTALPLWIAFSLARRKPTRRFTYGLGRLEDLAGVFIVLVILASAAAAGYESVVRFFDPRPVKLVWVVAAAALIGFAGNEWVARLRIKVGQEIKSAALEADGRHARIDGLTSLSVLFGALGSRLGYPLVDPVVGMLITLTILHIVWDTAKSVLMRLLDGVDPGLVDKIESAVKRTDGVEDISEVRVRWIGHQLLAEINLAVKATLSVAAGHDVAEKARHAILQQIDFISNVVIHVDPLDSSGEAFHRSEGRDEDKPG
ncbi:MAG: cation diffusion facilitator family transporter [Desulfobacterales bacterium]|jgi:cation diffusion facilitator family transporter